MDWQTPRTRFRRVHHRANVRALIGKPPATGAWREGDPVGHRRFASSARSLEHGGHCRRCGSRTRPGASWSRRRQRRARLHALTGDSHVVGAAGPGHPTAGWWSGIVGPGKAIDTDRWFVVAPNLLGGCQGGTGPASLAPDGREWGARFPYLTIRDQVDAQAALADQIGMTLGGRVGGSMGGMHALEWAVSRPDALERVAVIAAPAISTADQIALTRCRSRPSASTRTSPTATTTRLPTARVRTAGSPSRAGWRSSTTGPRRNSMTDSAAVGRAASARSARPGNSPSRATSISTATNSPGDSTRTATWCSSKR